MAGAGARGSCGERGPAHTPHPTSSGAAGVTARGQTGAPSARVLCSGHGAFSLGERQQSPDTGLLNACVEDDKGEWEEVR